MKITKFGHACLLVELGGQTPRTALFDPGSFSSVDTTSLSFLDDILITHGHGDHIDETLIAELVSKFPDVRITAPRDVVASLRTHNILASDSPSEGIVFFESPHEIIKPYYPVDPPEQIGFHYLNQLTHPGDSHSFSESMEILALPVQAPWGSTVDAVALAVELQPKYIIPIHDWHWSDAARHDAYATLTSVFGQHGITFIAAENGKSFTI